MNSKYNGSMGFQRLIKEIKRDVGGPPGPDSVSSANIINRTIISADIALATIDISNLSASCISSLSGGGGGGGLTANSVNSSHIQDGTILGSDIANNTITYKNLIPFGNIRIINGSSTEVEFNYELYVFNTITQDYDFLAYATRLKRYNSFSHFYQADFNTNMKLIIMTFSGWPSVDVDEFSINQGAETVDIDGNELIFKIGNSSLYQNIEIDVSVVI